MPRLIIEPLPQVPVPLPRGERIRRALSSGQSLDAFFGPVAGEHQQDEWSRHASSILSELRKIDDLPDIAEDYLYAAKSAPDRPLAVRGRWRVTDLEHLARGEELRRLVLAALCQGDHATLSPSVFFSDDVIARANTLALRGMVDAAVDVINESFDEMFRCDRFSLCDTMLLSAPVKDLTTDVLLAILTATLPGRNQLVARSKFFDLARDEIARRGELEEGLLAGL